MATSPKTRVKIQSDYSIPSQVAMSSAGKTASAPAATSSSSTVKPREQTPSLMRQMSSQVPPTTASSSKVKLREQTPSLMRQMSSRAPAPAAKPSAPAAKPSAPATKKSGLSNFGKAFKSARSAGKSEFTFGGKKYNTKLKGE